MEDGERGIWENARPIKWTGGENIHYTMKNDQELEETRKDKWKKEFPKFNKTPSTLNCLSLIINQPE